MWKHLSHAGIVPLRRAEAEAAAYLRHAAVETTWDCSQPGMPLPVTPIASPFVVILQQSAERRRRRHSFDWQDERRRHNSPKRGVRGRQALRKNTPGEMKDTVLGRALKKVEAAKNSGKARNGGKRREGSEGDQNRQTVAAFSEGDKERLTGKKGSLGKTQNAAPGFSVLIMRASCEADNLVPTARRAK